jgi:hypothetical protein
LFFLLRLCWQFVSESDLDSTSLKVIQKKKLLSLVHPVEAPALVRSSSGFIDAAHGANSSNLGSSASSIGSPMSKRPFRPPPPPPALTPEVVGSPSLSGSRKQASSTPKVSWFV